MCHIGCGSVSQSDEGGAWVGQGRGGTGGRGFAHRALDQQLLGVEGRESLLLSKHGRRNLQKEGTLPSVAIFTILGVKNQALYALLTAEQF